MGGALAAAGACLASPLRAASRAPVRLRRGVNAWPWFSLTREYPAPRIDYAWPPFQTQRPVPTRRDLERLRAAGLDFIRLPVDPGPFLAAASGDRARLMDMLFDAIGAINAAGLTTIVNLHANGATHHWTPERMTARVDAPEFRAYKILLSDIATRLRSSSSGPVVLEPVNEPSDVCAAPAFRGVQKKLFAAVRAVAPELPLVATGGCGSMIAGLEALDPGELDAFAPMIFTFHFYEPYLFSHQGAPWMREPIYRALNRVPWPASAGSLEATLAAVRSRQDSDRESTEGAKAEAWRITERELKVYFEAQPDRAYIERWFARVAAWAKRHGVPHERVLLGEFGALRSDGRYVAAQAPDRARYISDVRESAEKFGFPWAFWNLFDGMGLMDDATRAFDPPIIEALGLRLAPS